MNILSDNKQENKRRLVYWLKLLKEIKMQEYVLKQANRFKENYPKIIIQRLELDEWTYKKLDSPEFIGEFKIVMNPKLIKQQCHIIGNEGNYHFSLIGVK